MIERRARARQLADPADAERRATRWLVLSILVFAAVVSARGSLEPRLPPGRFGDEDALLSGRRLDPNTASPEALAAVPGLGPKRAAALVETRRAAPFWSVGELDRVPGIGPASIPALAIWLDPGLTGPPPRAPRVDLNTASTAELDGLPGIGPALAARILADRAARGPYRRAADLARVPGIGPAKVRGLAGRVSPP